MTATAAATRPVTGAASVDNVYLRVRELTKTFGTFTALRDISLEIRESEFVCFLGPSGCGKTTLLRAIAGLDIQTHGSIEQRGRDISTLPPSERDFGIVFQSYALFPNLSIAANIGYGLTSRRRPRREIDARVDELLELVGLPAEKHKYPAQLSGGQQQRVALARALATSPGLLLLDEPLSALDARVRVHLRREIRDLQRRLGVTTIMVTHDQEEALTMADRIVIMDHGVIEQVGTPLEVYREPDTRFVAGFVGTMNALRGRVIDGGRIGVGELELACPGAARHAPGDAVEMCLRPEDIDVRESGADTSNRVPAEVESLEFLGSLFRATLRSTALAEQALLADLSVGFVREAGIDVGSELAVTLPADRLRLFPAS